MASVQAALALHAAGPKVEAFYQHYGSLKNVTTCEEGESWIDWYGETVCTEERLRELTIEGLDTKHVDGSQMFVHSCYFPLPICFILTRQL
jgi:Thioredoxin-like domain